MITIRNEEVKDYQRVEAITRKALWNLYVQGCNEHYLVHVMRSYKDFLHLRSVWHFAGVSKNGLLQNADGTHV
jgi:predicted N-acetyltransferase YhbS